MWRVDGTRTREEHENLAASPGDARSLGVDSRPFASGARPFEPVGSLSDAEMVCAAALAMLDGRGELAEFLMREVRQRRDRAAANVVPISSKRPGERAARRTRELLDNCGAEGNRPDAGVLGWAVRA
jgi:hypothetical protein